MIAYKELAFQKTEKEKRAAELIIANKELIFQNEEKEKRAQELILANKELAFQNEEKEKRAIELIFANTELEKSKEKLLRSEIQIRKFAQHLHRVQEEEKAHVAREIHDELGQELVGIKIGIDNCLKFYSVQLFHPYLDYMVRVERNNPFLHAPFFFYRFRKKFCFFEYVRKV